jgi:hypothetical protein
MSVSKLISSTRAVNTDAHALVLRNFSDTGGKNLISRGEFAVRSIRTLRAAHPCPRAVEALPRSHHAKAVDAHVCRDQNAARVSAMRAGMAGVRCQHSLCNISVT